MLKQTRETLKVCTAIPDVTWQPPSNSPHRGENQPTSPPLGGIEGGLSTKTGIAGVCIILFITILLTACGNLRPEVSTVRLDRTAQPEGPRGLVTADPAETTEGVAQQVAPEVTNSPTYPAEPAATPSPTNTPEPTIPTATKRPTHTATPQPTPTPQPPDTPTVTPSPTLPPNLLGRVLVLEYHLIREPEDRWQRTPANFRADLERLHAEGYTPANIIDLTLGFPDLPAGRKPIVLTFDDSDISQFRYLDDGAIDPDCAVGILDDFHRQHPADWPLKSTFYVLQDVNVPDRVLFGQKEFQDKKLQWLVEHGFEVASHTISHFDLTDGTDDQVQWQLAVSQRQLEARLPGYDVQSLSLPFGNYPVNETLLKQGVWDGEPYTYANAVMVAGGASPSPHSPEFNAYHIPRVQALQTELDYWLGYFAENPQFYYVSAGPGEN